jgi:uncharacterized tellurite resistance protein B-like protein
MEDQQTLLKDYTDIEKGAYLGAIASIATADHEASDEEIEYMTTLADSAGLSDEQKQSVARAAKELSPDELKRCLDILKTSELRYSLMADMINFAKTDGDYSDIEKTDIEKMADYLEINQQQFSLLDQFTDKTSAVQAAPEEIQKPGFLSSLGLGNLEDKFKNSGMNMSSLTKGLLGIAGPMILASMMRKGISGRRGMGGSNFGNRGRLGSMGFGSGGFGSIISALSGGRGYSGSGGLLGRMLRL